MAPKNRPAAPSSSIPPLVAPSLRSEQAYRQIREMIITLALPPAAVINEAALMAQLGLGRTPVREALQRLSWEKLVVIVPRRGIFVAEIEPDDLAHIFEVRREMECFAAYRAASQAAPEAIAALATLLREAEGQLAVGDHLTLIQLDRRFHEGIAQSTGNILLSETLDRLYSLSLRLWYASLGEVEHLREAVAEHRQIVAAIAAGDGEDAGRLMADHVERFQREISLVLSPAVFPPAPEGAPDRCASSTRRISTAVRSAGKNF